MEVSISGLFFINAADINSNSLQVLSQKWVIKIKKKPINKVEFIIR